MTQPNQSEHMTQEELVEFMLNPATIDRAAKGMIERKRAKIMDDQSELYAILPFVWGEGEVAILNAKHVTAYITANYTPNTKLKALIEASEKLNLEFHGRPDCKNCALQEQLAELMKGEEK